MFFNFLVGRVGRSLHCEAKQKKRYFCNIWIFHCIVLLYFIVVRKTTSNPAGVRNGMLIKAKTNKETKKKKHFPSNTGFYLFQSIFWQHVLIERVFLVACPAAAKHLLNDFFAFIHLTTTTTTTTTAHSFTSVLVG